MPSNLRDLTPQDTDAAALLFFAAVHQGTADVYSAEQRIAWAGNASLGPEKSPHPPHGEGGLIVSRVSWPR